MIDLLAAIFLAYNCGKQICLQVSIIAEVQYESRKQDAAEAHRHAKISFVNSNSTVRLMQSVRRLS